MNINVVNVKFLFNKKFDKLFNLFWIGGYVKFKSIFVVIVMIDVIIGINCLFVKNFKNGGSVIL